jgi:hypothetical protein
MGPAQGAAGSIGQSLSGDHDPAGEVARRVEGRPVAMGLVAFGVGFVAGSILPASRTERELAHQVEPQVGRAIEGAVSTAQEAGEHLAPAARDEAAALKDEASAAASNVADRGRGESEGTTLPQPPQPSQQGWPGA